MMAEENNKKSENSGEIAEEEYSDDLTIDPEEAFRIGCDLNYGGGDLWMPW